MKNSPPKQRKARHWGDRGKEKPKFRVGDNVLCTSSVPMPFVDFEGLPGPRRKAQFVGTILNYSNCGENKHNQWEYEVTNAPMLFVGVPLRIWEHEIQGIVQ